MEGQKEVRDVSGGGGEEESLMMEESRFLSLCRREREQRREGERENESLV